MTGARHVSSLPSLPSSYHLIENTFTNTDEGWRQAFSILHVHFHVSMSIVHKPYQCNLHDTPPHMILLKKKNIHKVCQTRGRGGASNFFRRLYPFPCSFPCLYMSISKNHVNVIFMPMTLMSILIFNTMTTVQYGDDDGVSDD